MLLVRDWISLDHALPWGILGDPVLVRTNKLTGWLTAGVWLGRWSWNAATAGIFWELISGLLFAAAICVHVLNASAVSHSRLRLFKLSPALFSLVLLAVASALSLWCFGGIPHVQDTIAQQLQAQIFAKGQLTGTAPPFADQLANEFVIQRGTVWYAQYPPIQPALLAVGILTGTPWLVNPLLGAGAALLIFGAAREAYGLLTARVSLLLFCFSPMVWFMSAERMNHGATLFFVAGALYALSPSFARVPRRLSLGRVSLGGICLGLAISSRPLCGVAVALPLTAGYMWSELRWHNATGAPSRWFASALALGGGLLLGVLPLLGFNAATTGSLFRSGYEARWGSSGWGFGTSQWGPPHTISRGILNTTLNWDAAGKYLLEWPFPTQFLLPTAFLLRRNSRMETVLLGILASVTLAYLPYFYQDLCLGPRFLYAATPALILLTARGLLAVGLALARHRRLCGRSGVNLVLRTAALCGAVGVTLNLPVLLRNYGRDFWGTSDSLTEAVRRAGIHQGVVFIQDYNFARRVQLTRRGVRWRTAHAAVTDLDERWLDERMRALGGGENLEREIAGALLDRTRAHHRRRMWWIDYRGPNSNVSLGFHANTPDPASQDVIYAAAVDQRSDSALLNAYPGRAAWLYDYDPVLGVFALRPRSLGRPSSAPISGEKLQTRKKQDARL